MAQQVQDLVLSLLWLGSLAGIHSLAQELPHAMSIAKKRKKKRISNLQKSCNKKKIWKFPLWLSSNKSN